MTVLIARHDCHACGRRHCDTGELACRRCRRRDYARHLAGASRVHAGADIVLLTIPFANAVGWAFERMETAPTVRRQAFWLAVADEIARRRAAGERARRDDTSAGAARVERPLQAPSHP